MHAHSPLNFEKYEKWSITVTLLLLNDRVFFEIPIGLVNLPNLTNIPAKLKKMWMPNGYPSQ